MDSERFISQVRQRAHLDSNAEAMRSVCATLKTLGERAELSGAGHVAAQLPPEFQLFLSQGEGPQRFDLDEFYQRIAEKEGSDADSAEGHARAVIDVLREAISRGQRNHIRSQLSTDYVPLFAREIPHT